MHRNKKYINPHVIGLVLFIMIGVFREVKPLVWYRGTELPKYKPQ
jgi:hypothetical protein